MSCVLGGLSCLRYLCVMASIYPSSYRLSMNAWISLCICSVGSEFSLR